MRWLSVLFLLVISGAAQSEENEIAREDEATTTEVLPELPGWEEEELEDLESGEYVPGSSLIGELAREALESDVDEVIEIPESIRALPEEEIEDEEQATELPEDFVEDYFQKSPQGRLNDPQDLLTTQEFRDREGFLGYHARDVGIAFYLYLFDRNQEIPNGLGLEQLVRSQFDPREPTAVVFYFLGAPERAGVAFSEQVIQSADEERRARVLKAALVEALEKSDPLSQLEAFSVGISTGLSLLEEDIISRKGSLTAPELMAADRGEISDQNSGWVRKLMKNEGLFWGVIGSAILVVAGLLGWLGRRVASMRETYVFPDAEGSTLFDAPHASGVGGVLSFSSTNTPPSSQKKDIPDYLQRM